LFGLEPTDIKGPLVQFQAAKFEASEIKRVVKMINSELGENSLAADVFDQVFNMWWPKLESDVSQVRNIPAASFRSRSERDMLEEVLALSRSISKTRVERRDEIHPEALEELLRVYSSLVGEFKDGSPAQARLLRRLIRPIEYIVDVAGRRADTAALLEEVRKALHDLDEVSTLDRVAKPDATQEVKLKQVNDDDDDEQIPF
jgi:hypothetical protein